MSLRGGRFSRRSNLLICWRLLRAERFAHCPRNNIFIMMRKTSLRQAQDNACGTLIPIIHEKKYPSPRFPAHTFICLLAIVRVSAHAFSSRPPPDNCRVNWTSRLRHSRRINANDNAHQNIPPYRNAHPVYCIPHRHTDFCSRLHRFRRNPFSITWAHVQPYLPDQFTNNTDCR